MKIFVTDAGADGDADEKAKAVNAISEIISEASQKSREELNKHFQEISKVPDPLVTGREGSAALAALVKSGAKKISFQRLQGFDGIDEFEPSGWQVEVDQETTTSNQASQDESPRAWPMGVGMAIMNGCFGRNYGKGDPCYEFSSTVTRCINQIDAANFIGVGFDGRGYYSSESRKKSIIQRVCAGKASFMGRDVPDNMNAFGLYGKFIKFSIQLCVHYVNARPMESPPRNIRIHDSVTNDVNFRQEKGNSVSTSQTFATVRLKVSNAVR